MSSIAPVPGSNQPISNSPRIRLLLGLLSWSVTLVALGVSLWSLSGDLHWTGDLLADHRWQIGWVCLFCAGVASAVRAWWASGTLFLLCLLHLRPELALSLPSQDVYASGARLRVATLTAGFGEDAPERLAEWLVDEEPDLALIALVDRDGRELLEHGEGRFVALWPEREQWDEGTRGLGLWAREGLDVDAVTVEDGLLEAEVAFGAQPVRILGLRPPHVIDARSAARRDEQLGRAAERAAAGPSVVVLGELNATGYSGPFRRLLRDGGLRDSRQGFGRQATWASDVTPMGFVLAADHVLIGDALRCVARDHHWDVGSDHQPVLAELVLAGGA